MAGTPGDGVPAWIPPRHRATTHRQSGTPRYKPCNGRVSRFSTDQHPATNRSNPVHNRAIGASPPWSAYEIPYTPPHIRVSPDPCGKSQSRRVQRACVPRVSSCRGTHRESRGCAARRPRPRRGLARESSLPPRRSPRYAFHYSREHAWTAAHAGSSAAPARIRRVRM